MTGIRPLDTLQRLHVGRLTEDNGFGFPQAERDGWLTFKGIACPHLLWIARRDPHWLVGLAHAGAMADIERDEDVAEGIRPDGGPAAAVEELGPIIRRLFALARSLPTAPLETFAAATLALPRMTEAERLVVQRVGQDIFRDALLVYWGGACPLTGITHPRLLRASHMKPWADCATDGERLDVHNGLLLAAHLDAAFDAGLITFTDDCRMRVSDALSADDRARLGLAALPPLPALKPAHLPYLAHHRKTVFRH